MTLVGERGNEDGVDQSSFDLNLDAGMFQEWGGLVTYAIRLLYSDFNFCVQSSIVGEDASEVFELFTLVEFDIADVNAEPAWRSANLHCFCLANILTFMPYCLHRGSS